MPLPRRHAQPAAQQPSMTTEDEKLYQVFEESKSLAASKSTYIPALTGFGVGAGVWWHSSKYPQKYHPQLLMNSRFPLLAAIVGSSFAITGYMHHKESQEQKKNHFELFGYSWPLTDEQRKVIMEIDTWKRSEKYEQQQQQEIPILEQQPKLTGSYAARTEDEVSKSENSATFNKNSFAEPEVIPVNKGEELSLNTEKEIKWRTWDDVQK